MKKYKLNTDNKPITPSKKGVDSNKDFGKLFHQYEKYTKRPKKPIYKDPKFFLFVLIVVLVGYIIFNEIQETNKKEVEPQEVGE